MSFCFGIDVPDSISNKSVEELLYSIEQLEKRGEFDRRLLPSWWEAYKREKDASERYRKVLEYAKYQASQR